jgi:hypothetical protein
MNNAPLRKVPPFVREGGRGVVFDPQILEVSIIDRSGRAIWKKTTEDTPSPIRWNGIDAAGQLIQSGDYLCKLIYSDERVSYLPFVFITNP